MSKLKILFKICTRSYNRFYLHPVYTMRWIFCSDTSRVIIEKRNERWISASLSRQDSQFLSVSWCRDRILLFIFEPLVHGACAKWKRARLPRIGDTRIDFSLSLFLSFSARVKDIGSEMSRPTGLESRVYYSTRGQPRPK